MTWLLVMTATMREGDRVTTTIQWPSKQGSNLVFYIVMNTYVCSNYLCSKFHFKMYK